MADQFADAFKRYWAIIVSVAGMCMFCSAAMYKVSADYNSAITELKVAVALCRADIERLELK